MKCQIQKEFPTKIFRQTCVCACERGGELLLALCKTIPEAKLWQPTQPGNGCPYPPERETAKLHYSFSIQMCWREDTPGQTQTPEEWRSRGGEQRRASVPPKNFCKFYKKATPHHPPAILCVFYGKWLIHTHAGEFPKINCELGNDKKLAGDLNAPGLWRKAGNKSLFSFHTCVFT